MNLTVDIIVVGAGHAGVESALAAARMGCNVALLTVDPAAVSRMSCNPAIGGLGKGHIVHEVDALGGQMGLCADATGIHFRRLNTRKGAAVRGTRCQSDRARYSQEMARVVAAEPRLSVLAGKVTALLTAPSGVPRVVGVALDDGRRVGAQAVVLTTGTFLRGLMHTGAEQTPGGRRGEPAAHRLSDALRGLGLRLGRLKTGTPCRLDGRTIDTDRLERQPGHDPVPRFSRWSAWPDGRPPLRQIDCHIAYTNPRTHEIIADNLHRSPMYSGAITVDGPRYCPSIEDKIVRFADRDRHQIFVEPEGLDTHLVYPNGISTALPADAQEAFVRSIVGFERAEIVRLGYAVEYDFSDPTQLLPSLQVRHLPGLFLAGQINGTTGYEEAAGQGLLAGINAALVVRDRPPLHLGREQAYIGVMVDDLVTKGTREPYRMFTSRAEYRLLLREDNADERLTPIGRELGLIDDVRWAAYCASREQASALSSALETTRAKGDGALDPLLLAAGSVAAQPGASFATLLRRPQVTVDVLAQSGRIAAPLLADSRVVERVEIAIKYGGYIARQRDEAERLGRLEGERLPADLDYAHISGLSNEIRQKLEELRPLSLGQASRIPGVTPAAVALLHVHTRALRS